MKKTLAVLSVFSLAGCEYDVREEPAQKPYESPTYPSERAPLPSSSSSEPKLPPASSSTSDGDASAAPAHTCEGTAMDCEAFDSLTCNQSGCTAMTDGTCMGSPTPCRWLVTEVACGEQMGCTWTPPPPR